MVSGQGMGPLTFVLSGICWSVTLSVHEGRRFMRGLQGVGVTVRAHTRGAPAGVYGWLARFRGAGLGTHKGCPYGGLLGLEGPGLRKLC